MFVEGIRLVFRFSKLIIYFYICTYFGKWYLGPGISSFNFELAYNFQLVTNLDNLTSFF